MEAEAEVRDVLEECKHIERDRVPQHLEVRAREVLAFAKLRQCYPDACTADVRAAATRVVASLPADIIDACWIACGPRPPSQWSSEGQALLPPDVKDMQPDVLAIGLSAFFQRSRDALAAALRKRFPARAEENEAAPLRVVDELWEALTKTQFWKGHALLMSDCLLPQESASLAVTQLTSPPVLEKLRAFLDSSLALCPEEIEKEEP